MSLRYSFIGQDFDIVFANAHLIFPGIKKMIAIYFDEESGKVLAEKCVNPIKNCKIDSLSIIDDHKKVINLRKENHRTQWINPELLPFNDIAASKEDRGIFNEFENISLILRFLNKYDQANDILILYFNNNQSNFGIGRSDKPLTADNKSVIETMSFNFFNTFIQNSRNDRMIHKRVKIDTGNFKDEAKAKQEELDYTRNNYHQSIANLCIHYMKEISEDLRKTYLLSDGAIKKFQSYEGNISQLKKILENTVIYIENTLTDPELDPITIDEWQINLNSYQSKAETKFSIKLFEEKYRRTIELLDMLETAAQRVLQRQVKLTSANVGMECKNVMSAPGITDKLSNHGKKIKALFEKYPEKWPVIRDEFRPIQNLFISWEQQNLAGA